jgi:Tfp pilus assembly protein PilF
MTYKKWSAAPIAGLLLSLAAPVGSVATFVASPVVMWAQQEAPEETAEACRTRGIALLKEGKHEEAAAELAKALEIDPKDAYAHYYFGMVNSKLGKKDLMVKHYQSFLKLAPDAPEAPRVRALLKSL